MRDPDVVCRSRWMLLTGGAGADCAVLSGLPADIFETLDGGVTVRGRVVHRMRSCAGPTVHAMENSLCSMSGPYVEDDLSSDRT